MILNKYDLKSNISSYMTEEMIIRYAENGSVDGLQDQSVIISVFPICKMVIQISVRLILSIRMVLLISYLVISSF